MDVPADNQPQRQRPDVGAAAPKDVSRDVASEIAGRALDSRIDAARAEQLYRDLSDRVVNYPLNRLEAERVVVDRGIQHFGYLGLRYLVSRGLVGPDAVCSPEDAMESAYWGHCVMIHGGGLDTVTELLSVPDNQQLQDSIRAGQVAALDEVWMYEDAMALTETIASEELRAQIYGDFAIRTARSSSINQAYLLLSEYASGYDVSFAVRVLNATDFALRNPDLADASASLELQSEDEVKQFRYLCDAIKLSRLFGTAESESAWSVVSGAKGQQHYPVLLQNYFELVGERGTPSQRSWALKQLQKPGKLGLTPMHRNAMVSGAAHTADFDFIEKISAVTNRRTDEVLSIPITNGLLMRYQSLTHQIGVQISLAEQGGAAVGDEDQ